MFFSISLIIILVLILVVIVLGLVLLHKLKKILGVSSISSIVKHARVEDEEIPKSLSNLDSLYLDKIKEDFPELNLNELKRECEKNILLYLQAIENNDSKNIKNDKIKLSIDKALKEYESHNINFKKIRFYKTVVSKYENNQKVSTIMFGSSLEYLLYVDGKLKKKVQDRFRIEYIYILDSSIVSKKDKVFEVSCPNCGAVMIDLENHRCSYCGTYVKDIVKRVWYCNDLVSY